MQVCKSYLRFLFLFLAFLSYSQENTLQAEEKGIWGNGELRKNALEVSKEIPFAIYAYDFCERYVTKLQKLSPNERCDKMQRDEVQITRGDLERIPLLTEKSIVKFEEHENTYVIAFYNDAFPILEMQFPASCQLIKGKNLIELENEFITQVSLIDKLPVEITPPIEVNKDQVQHLTKDYYILRNDFYYIEQINSHLYFEKKKDRFIPLFSVDYPEESIANFIALDEICSDACIDLTIRKYGLAQKQMKVPFHSFMNYLKEQGCQLYTGIEGIDSRHIKTVVFAVNTSLKYNHVLTMNIPYNLLKNQLSDIDCNINLFIPTHNIASLFDENSIVNKRHTKKIIK